MIYNPPAFKVEDIGLLHKQIEATGLAMLVTVDDEGAIVSHIPLFLDRDAGRHGKLVGHLSRANPQVGKSNTEIPALAVFPGPDAHISPGWYASKREHGKVVPTWNYAVVHVSGLLKFFDDRDRLRAAVDRLTAMHESKFSDPWATKDAPPEYIEAQLKGIIGIEIEIENIIGKHKLSQNRAAVDQAGVAKALGESLDQSASRIGKMMDGNLARRR
jgi:transcriptional regulator